MDEQEEWRDVVGYEGLYQVSNLGWVRETGTGRILHHGRHNGYISVGLGHGITRHKMSYVHRLVVEAFIGPIPKEMHTHHKNGNRADNRLENLEILTVSEHRSREYILECSRVRPIGRGGGMTMFDRARGYTR